VRHTHSRLEDRWVRQQRQQSRRRRRTAHVAQAQEHAAPLAADDRAKLEQRRRAFANPLDVDPDRR
jgi:hypothetical protein